MRLTRAADMRGILIALVVFVFLTLSWTNPHRQVGNKFKLLAHVEFLAIRYWSWYLDSSEKEPTLKGPKHHVPNTPLSPREDIITPFGHTSKLFDDCPNNNTANCLKFLQNYEPKHIRNSSDELLVFHTAWTGGMVPVHQFLLYSYLATQNLNKSILVYWLEASGYNNFTSNPLLAPFKNHPNIVFKCFNLTDLAKDTPLDLSKIKDNKRRLSVLGLLSAKGALWGDLVRMLILFKYGGMYVDVDVILLRPMDVFMQNEFAYLWAAQEGRMNTAVFSLQKGGKSIKSLFLRIIGRKSSFHPWKLYQIINEQNLPVVVYPSPYFDPAWNVVEEWSPKEGLPYDTFSGFFDKVEGEFNFWNGAYAYHFHNMYKTLSWDEDTWAGMLLTQMKARIRDNENNRNELIGVKPEHADLLVEQCKTSN